MYLRFYDCWKTQAEKLHRAGMPTMLLLSISFIRLRNFTKDLKNLQSSQLSKIVLKIFQEIIYRFHSNPSITY